MSDSNDPEFWAQSEKDTWRTPEKFWGKIAEYEGGIDLDPCAAPVGPIAEMNLTIEPPEHPDIYQRDGLDADWGGVVFVNPPFSSKTEWLAKAVEEYEAGNTDLIAVVVPDSTDTISWWHEYIAGVADYVWFKEGRLSYLDSEGNEQGSPTFGTALILYGEPSDELLEWLMETGHLVQTVKDI